MWTAALAAGAISTLLAFGLSLRPDAWLGGLPLSEDGFYALAVARHLALGNGLTVDGQLTTNGFQPLWVFLSAPIYSTVQGDRTAGLRGVLFLSTAIWAAVAWGLAHRTRRLAEFAGVDGRWAFALTLLMTLGSAPLFQQFHNGLETGLNVLCLLLCVELMDAADGITPRWHPWALGGALGLCFYSRLDNVFFLGVAALLVAVAQLRRRMFSWPDWMPFVGAGLLASPWLLRNLFLDGHLVPSSGRAQMLEQSLRDSIGTLLYALGSWAFPWRVLPVGFPFASVAWAIVGTIVVLTLAFRQRAAWSTYLSRHRGSQALAAHLVLLAAFYGLFFGANYFLLRYMTPVVLLTIPAIAVGLAGLAERTRRLAWLIGSAVTAVAFVNAGTLTEYLRTAKSPAFVVEQTSYALDRIDAACTAGALQTGTLGYFRDRVINLDGKVNRYALDALAAGRLPDYVRQSPIDVVIDWPALCDRALGAAHEGFAHVTSLGEFDVWVREGREACVRGRERGQL